MMVFVVKFVRLYKLLTILFYEKNLAYSFLRILILKWVVHGSI